MNKISVFGGTGFIGGTFCKLYSDLDYPNAMKVFDNVFFVGCSPTITDSMVEYIEEVIESYKKKIYE